ncbi:hypothetical protein VTK73DRAFT_6624 [Phialemonium thermophilum]|uniref:Zn(2)-C6 fungal-type domain-containing protein n=1 Tax=Phialemonium thermophilum TaxID=223376 RepID=A0ABR3XWG2_9PEZI
MDSKVQTVPQTEGPKRRACDECRSRKLACSKEPEGCSRCMKEGIKCNYSPQKPMGRPRKRPLEQVRPTEDGHIHVPSAMADTLAETSMDLDLAFLDVNDESLNFFDMLAPDPRSGPNLLDRNVSAGTKHAPHSSQVAFFNASSLVGEPYDFFQPTLPDVPPATGTSSSESASNGSTPPSDSFSWPRHESDVPPAARSCPNGGPIIPAPEPAVCGCLASLYLALDSLQSPPREVIEAIRVARTAAKTAYDTILCPVCGNPPLTMMPPIASLQNMLVLGALMSTLSSAYKRILQMVEDETVAAERDGRKLTFPVDSCGGYWGQLASCTMQLKLLQGNIMGPLDPRQWRMIARALLRADVYGLGSSHCLQIPDDDESQNLQPCLKDIINMLEERSRKRHEQIDALVAAGIVVPDHNCNYKPLSSGEKPTCLRIIDIAKQSMRELVIP